MPWQVLIRRELEEAAKVLGERVRTGEATSEVRRLIRSLACLLQGRASPLLGKPIRHGGWGQSACHMSRGQGAFKPKGRRSCSSTRCI